MGKGGGNLQIEGSLWAKEEETFKSSGVFGQKEQETFKSREVIVSLWKYYLFLFRTRGRFVEKVPIRIALQLPKDQWPTQFYVFTDQYNAISVSLKAKKMRGKKVNFPRVSTRVIHGAN